VCDDARMPRALSAFLALAATALLAGCGSSAPPPLPSGPAPPQSATLGWVERFPSDGPALVFTAHSFAITSSGWTAELALENETGISWQIVENPATNFGVMLFTTGDVTEVERRSRDDDLPGLRAAQTFEPRLPETLTPGASWRGTIAAPGSLASGLFARIVFGQLVAVGEPPKTMPTQFSWITDHAYELEAH
jgi:hypothetical protein